MPGASYSAGTYVPAGRVMRDNFRMKPIRKMYELSTKERMCYKCLETNVMPKGCLIHGCDKTNETIPEEDETYFEDVAEWMKHKKLHIEWSNFYVAEYKEKIRAKRNAKRKARV